MMVFLFLGYDKYLVDIKAPAASLDEFYAGVLPDSSDEDSD
jgi:hypothetical protein